MIRSTIRLGILFCGASLSAQELPPGTWKGTFRIEKGPETVVEYVTHVDADSAAVFIRSVVGEETELLHRRVEGDTYVFSWGALECRLSVKGNTREGPCRAADGTSGKLMLDVPSRPAGATSDRRVERSSDVVTSEELLGTQAHNVQEALQHIRPLWFNTRAPAGDELPWVTVFVNGVPVGGVEALCDLPLLAVSRIRYYNSSRAIIRFGKKYALGVIDVDEGVPK